MPLLLSTTLARQPDSTRVLPEKALVELVDDLNRTTRRAWADRGLLRKRPGRNYEEFDALELAAFFRLYREVGDFYDAALAWKGVQERLRADLDQEGLRADLARKRLIAVVDKEAKQGTLVTAVRDIGPLVINGHLFQTVELTTVARDVCEAFRRAVDVRRR